MGISGTGEQGGKDMNPEIQFHRRYDADYTGLSLREIPFGTMKDVHGQEKEYRLDFITAEELRDETYPCVIFVHGGGFTQPCDKRQAYISLFAKHLTRAGYIVVSPDYPVFDDEAQRDAAGGEKPAAAIAAEAVHLAYCYLENHAAELRIDMDRIAIMGGSAGGMTAFYAVAGYQDAYRALINLWGAPGILPDLSAFPPTLSVHGDADPLVDYSRELRVLEGLEAHSIPHGLITLEGSGHTPLNRLDEFLPLILKHLGTWVSVR